MATNKSTSRPRPSGPQHAMERRIAHGLKLRRTHLGLSAGELAERSGVSRAMVSKIERHGVSPTAALLGRLCNGLGITLSSLIAGAETAAATPVARAASQPVWRDPGTGLRRTMISPLNTGSRTELVQVELPAGARIAYQAQQHTHYDQHLWVLQGRLTLTLDGEAIELGAGDCIRSRIDVAVAFSNRGRNACKYLVVIVR